MKNLFLSALGSFFILGAQVSYARCYPIESSSESSTRFSVFAELSVGRVDSIVSLRDREFQYFDAISILQTVKVVTNQEIEIKCSDCREDSANSKVIVNLKDFTALNPSVLVDDELYSKLDGFISGSILYCPN
jgi:hypothetical protein